VPFPGCGTGLATDEPGRWRRAAATGLALADYGRPHAPGAWSAAREPSGRDGDAQLPGAVNLVPAWRDGARAGVPRRLPGRYRSEVYGGAGRGRRGVASAVLRRARWAMQG
jgi:hypothetical protein